MSYLLSPLGLQVAEPLDKPWVLVGFGVYGLETGLHFCCNKTRRRIENYDCSYGPQLETSSIISYDNKKEALYLFL